MSTCIGFKKNKLSLDPQLEVKREALNSILITCTDFLIPLSKITQEFYKAMCLKSVSTNVPKDQLNTLSLNFSLSLATPIILDTHFLFLLIDEK